MYSTGHIDKKEVDQPKPTGEWTASPIGEILHNGEVMATAFTYAQGKACIDAINAALAEDQERVKKLADEWWGMALAAEREEAARQKRVMEQIQICWDGELELVHQLRSQLAELQGFAEKSRIYEKQLAAAQAAMKAARELVQNDVAKDFFVKHGQRFVPSILNLLEGDTAALDAAITAAQKPLVEALTEIRDWTEVSTWSQADIANAALAKVKEKP